MKRTFDGRLVAQDPEDEAARVLLERVWGVKERSISKAASNVFKDQIKPDEHKQSAPEQLEFFNE